MNRPDLRLTEGFFMKLPVFMKDTDSREFRFHTSGLHFVVVKENSRATKGFMNQNPVVRRDVGGETFLIFLLEEPQSLRA